MNLQLLCDQAITLQRRGELAQAERLYLQILVADPESFTACHRLGVIRFQQGRNAEALELIGAALKSKPDAADILIMHGLVLQAVRRLEEALVSYDKALALEPDNAVTLNNRGITLWHLSRVDEALASFDKALTIKPDSVGALNNRGNTLLDMKRFEEALADFDKVLVVKPDHAAALNNRGNALRDLKRYDEALASFDKALAIEPGNAEALNNRGNALRDLARLDEALASYEAALVVKPDYAEALNNRGYVFRDQGKLNAALACSRGALALKPDFAEAHINIGNALKDEGSPDEAEASYRRALQIKPSCTDALNNLALLRMMQGDFVTGLNIVRQSLQIEEAAQTKKIFVDCVKRIKWTHSDDKIRIVMVRALTEPWGRPSELARAGADLVKLNPDIGVCVARATRAWPRRLSAHDLFGSNGLAALAADPLLRALLSSTPNADMEMERLLTMVRRLMLEAGASAAPDDESSAVLDFYAGLARQCFINEYLFCLADDEIQSANDLRDSLIAALDAGTRASALWVSAVAAYFPLSSLPRADRLLDRQWPEPVAAILVQQYREPDEERRLRVSVPRLTEIEDEVSRLVQNQYEENPYPRWVKAAPAGNPNNIVGYLCRKFPLATFRRRDRNETTEFLIAGCGTGQHPIETAREFDGARVLAIDLSLRSLAYAERKTRELGLSSITYAQADLLKLGSLGRSFDVIESVGVLHHLDDPFVGWQRLLSLLRPGGFMMLGFYSETARRTVLKARAFIAEQGYRATEGGIRRCRQDLMSLDESANFGALINSPDFFSTSSCRDLLFHSQERRMTLASIDAFLRDNGLTFLGFEIDGDTLHAYRQRFPNDSAATNLGQWQTFENDNPDIFTGMYQFWVQKTG